MIYDNDGGYLKVIEPGSVLLAKLIFYFPAVKMKDYLDAITII